MLSLKLKKLVDGIELPSFAHQGDAGMDLRAAEDAVIEPMSRLVMPCGFAMSMPDGYAALVIPRSGLAAKHGISVVNAPGLIDSGYRGEIKVILLNTDANEPFKVSKGDRIAQMMIVELPKVDVCEVEDLDETQRGIAGFGSSGVR